MSDGIISISIKDIQKLLQQLRRSQETIESDWNSVMIKWQNLQDSWKDSHRHQFEPIFEDLHRIYNESGRQQEESIQSLQNVVRTAEEPMEMGLINDNRSSFRQGGLTQDADKSIPKDNKEPSDLAKNLRYGYLNGNETYAPSFEKNDGGTLEAVFPDGRKSECRISYHLDDSGRVKISNINVPPSLQRQGIATLLFNDLERRVPAGTIFYFVENQNPLFWLKQGFRLHKTEGSGTEYIKKSSQH